MSKLVMDADGLIKLGKSKVLATLIRDQEVLVPEAVHEEAVVRGKRELYEDAFELERVLDVEGVPFSPTGSDPRADRLLEGFTSLGEGEKDTLRLYFAESADAVVSDDRVFLSFLSRYSIPFLTPANVIVGLARAECVSLGEGLEAMGRLERYVRAEVYKEARKELEELREGGEGHG